MNKPRIIIAAIALLLMAVGDAWAVTVFHTLADFEAGVPIEFEPQNGAILTQETLGATSGASSLGVQFTDTRPSDEGPQQHIFFGITATNDNYAKWQEAATLQATTARQFAVAYDMFLDFDGTALPAGATLFASDFRYNQDADPAATPNPIPGFQDTGGEYGIATRFDTIPTSDEQITVIIPFDEKDNPRSFFVNPNPATTFYQLQLGHKYNPVGLGGAANVYYDNFRILEYDSPTEQLLFSWETPDNGGTPENEQLEGWGPGVSTMGPMGTPLANHARAITTVGATDGASAMRIGTPNGITAPAFTWGSQVVYTQQPQVDDVASALDAAERVELDVTFTEAGNGTASFFSFFMHVSDSEGNFYQTPASQFNDLPNLELGEERTVTIQFNVREFRNSSNQLLIEDTLLGTTSLAIGIGTNEDSIQTVTISVDKLRIFSEAAPAETGDFDDDGDVDGSDFLAWQRGLGTTGTATLAQGDANDDGNVDAADLAIWKTQFGSAGAAPAADAVPECSSLALAMIGALAGFGRRRFSRGPGA